MGAQDASDVDASKVTQVLLNRFGVRVHPEMGQFVLSQLKDSTSAMIPIIGGDARTGVAVRQLFAAQDLRDAMRSSVT